MTRDSLDMLVCALCLDYARREEAIEKRVVSHRTEMEFRYYNFKIHAAVSEIVGEELALLFIDEIGNRTGYASTKCAYLSERSYKEQKRLVKENIARRLHLTDK